MAVAPACVLFAVNFSSNTLSFAGTLTYLRVG